MERSGRISIDAGNQRGFAGAIAAALRTDWPDFNRRTMTLCLRRNSVGAKVVPAGRPSFWPPRRPSDRPAAANSSTALNPSRSSSAAEQEIVMGAKEIATLPSETTSEIGRP